MSHETVTAGEKEKKVPRRIIEAIGSLVKRSEDHTKEPKLKSKEMRSERIIANNARSDISAVDVYTFGAGVILPRQSLMPKTPNQEIVVERTHENPLLKTYIVCNPIQGHLDPTDPTTIGSDYITIEQDSYGRLSAPVRKPSLNELWPADQMPDTVKMGPSKKVFYVHLEGENVENIPDVALSKKDPSDNAAIVEKLSTILHIAKRMRELENR